MRNKAAHEETTRDLLAELPPELWESLRHVLGCPVCQGLAQEALREREARRPPADVRPLLVTLEMHRPGLLASLEERAAEADRLFEELLQRPAGERAALAGGAGYRNLCLADLLLDESRAAQPRDPERSEELARLGLRIASQPHAKEELAWTEDVKVRGHCLVGNARRLQRDLPGAEGAFRSAAYHLTQPPDSCERAFYCRMVALLRDDQGRMDEAVGLFWRAAGIYRETGELLEEGGCLADLGALFVAEGEHERAVHPLARASEVLDGERAPGRMAQVRLGLALCHAALGHAAQAGREEEAARPFFEGLTEEDEVAAVCALRGRIAALTGREEEGAGLLEEARLRFFSAGRLHAAAQTTLDLAVLWAEAGRPERVARLVEEIAAGFAATPQRAGVLSALRGFAREVEQGPRTELGEAAVQAAEELRRHRRNPLLALEALARQQERPNEA